MPPSRVRTPSVASDFAQGWRASAGCSGAPAFDASRVWLSARRVTVVRPVEAPVEAWLDTIRGVSTFASPLSARRGRWRRRCARPDRLAPPPHRPHGPAGSTSRLRRRQLRLHGSLSPGAPRISASRAVLAGVFEASGPRLRIAFGRRRASAIPTATSRGRSDRVPGATRGAGGGTGGDEATAAGARGDVHAQGDAEQALNSGASRGGAGEGGGTHGAQRHGWPMVLRAAASFAAAAASREIGDARRAAARSTAAARHARARAIAGRRPRPRRSACARPRRPRPIAPTVASTAALRAAARRESQPDRGCRARRPARGSGAGSSRGPPPRRLRPHARDQTIRHAISCASSSKSTAVADGSAAAARRAGPPLALRRRARRDGALPFRARPPMLRAKAARHRIGEPGARPAPMPAAAPPASGRPPAARSRRAGATRARRPARRAASPGPPRTSRRPLIRSGCAPALIGGELRGVPLGGDDVEGCRRPRWRSSA